MIPREVSLCQRIVRSGHEVVPRFRMLTPGGEEIALVQLQDDMADRLERLQVIRALMLWKAARLPDNSCTSDTVDNAHLTPFTEWVYNLDVARATNRSSNALGNGLPLLHLALKPARVEWGRVRPIPL